MADWDASYPRGDVAFNTGDDSIRTNQSALEERLTKEHYFPDNGAAGGRMGRHKFGQGVTASRDGTLTNPSGGNVWYHSGRRSWQFYRGTTSKWVDAGFLFGEVRMLATSLVPEGWLLCDGSAISRTTYADLFSYIGTAWGVGDGVTTFNIPDLRGITPIGYHPGGDGDGDYGTIGGAYGEKKHVLTLAEMAAHAHGGFTGSGGGAKIADIMQSGNNDPTNAHVRQGDAGSADLGDLSTGNHNHTITSAGGDAAHENRQPSKVVAYFIYVGP